MAEGKTVFVTKVKNLPPPHHGGAWKVAYADFVTAMMAFFLLLWLLNAVTEEQMHGIADYFTPTTVNKSKSGNAQPLKADSPNASMVKMPLPPATLNPDGSAKVELDQEDGNETPEERKVGDQEIEKIAEQREQQQFDKAKQMLQGAVEAIPELKGMKDSLMVDNTPEGLRIQLVDQEGLSMFPTGSASPFGPARAMLNLVAKVVMQMPQKLAISGHTDATPFRSGETGYSNWELSADRALTSRRVLRGSGVPENRFAQVVGKADGEPLVTDNPKDPRNRRISIVLLRDHPGTSAPAVPLPAPISP